MKILIIRESDLKDSTTNPIYSIKNFEDIRTCSIIILIKNDGTYIPIKNRYGSPELIGKFGEILNLADLPDFDKIRGDH